MFTFTPTFNLVQQGINDLLGQTLSEVAGLEGTYVGSFEIIKSDGVFNKDGLAAITVNVPDPCVKRYGVPCGTDATDPYNLMKLELLRDFYVKYDETFTELTPQQLADAYRKSNLEKITQITPVSEIYNADDPRFMFGNPKFFMTKSI